MGWGSLLCLSRNGSRSYIPIVQYSVAYISRLFYHHLSNYPRLLSMVAFHLVLTPRAPPRWDIHCRSHRIYESNIYIYILYFQPWIKDHKWNNWRSIIGVKGDGWTLPEPFHDFMVVACTALPDRLGDDLVGFWAPYWTPRKRVRVVKDQG